MSNVNVIKSYYIGDPRSPHTRGQEKHGYVHTLVWGLIYEKGGFFAGKDEYAVGIGGGGIGNASSINEARQMIHAYAVSELQRKKQEAENLIKRIDDALTQLGDDPANLEYFRGEYKQKR